MVEYMYLNIKLQIIKAHNQTLDLVFQSTGIYI